MTEDTSPRDDARGARAVAGAARVDLESGESAAPADAAEVARRMEALGRLAGQVAHDFNNLLTVIVGYAQILQDTLPPADSRRDAASQIIRATERGTSLTQQLLAFGRRQVLVPCVVDLGAMVRCLEPELRRLVGPRLRLQLAVPPDLGLVNVDARQMEQVVMRLVTHARDSIIEEGTIRLELLNLPACKPPLPEQAVEGPYVCLRVSDTSPGFKAEDRCRAFEPFFTPRSGEKPKGIGLAMVYGVVQQSGGFCEADSVPGQGARYSLYLPSTRAELPSRPAVKSEAPAQPSVEAPASAPGGETVLVVEDDDLLRRLAVRALKSRGYEVLEASDGYEALTILAGCRDAVHLLLTDVVMPHMNGRQLAEAASELRPDMRVLYMSGYSQDAILQQGIETSRVEFLAKPFTREALAARVRAVLGQSRRL